MIPRGTTVKDKVTGITGIVVQYFQKIGGNTLMCIQPPMDKSGNIPDAVFLDEFGLDIVKTKKVLPNVPPVDDSVTIQLGEEVEDMASGFRGIATSKTVHLNGCVYFGVQPKHKEDKLMTTTLPEEISFGHRRLKKVGAGLSKVLKPTEEMEETGGPMVKAKTRRYA